MDANTKKRYDKAGPQVVKALEKRHFEAYYVSTAAEAVEKVVELIPKEHTVSWGGTATRPPSRSRAAASSNLSFISRVSIYSSAWAWSRAAWSLVTRQSISSSSPPLMMLCKLKFLLSPVSRWSVTRFWGKL